MRKKTDRKRQHILDTAYELFRSKGFANTSMSEITAKAGGSKATLYNYFSSKEELFVACMTNIGDDYVEGIFIGLEYPNAELSIALVNAAKQALRFLCSPEMLASKRLLVTEAERSEIGRIFYRKMDGYNEELATFLRRAMDAGHLHRGDPLLAARQFRALIETDIVERCLMGALKTPPSAAIVLQAAEEATATFLRAYAPSCDDEASIATDQTSP